MKNFFKFIILINALILSIFALCPDYPTIPTSSPILITSASPGMSNFPSSTQRLTVSFFMTPEISECSGDYYLFSVNFGTASDYLAVYLDCTSSRIKMRGPGPSAVTLGNPLTFPPGKIGPVGIFLSFRLGQAGFLKGNCQLDSTTGSAFELTFMLGATLNLYFKKDTQFYFCARQDGGLSQACTISNLLFEYRYNIDEKGFLAGTNPAIAAFYPLSGRSLATSIGSASSAYFGDKMSNPTTGTSPTWDSSKDFVTIASGQFLTVPYPDVSSIIPTISSSFSLSAWVRITEVPLTLTTLFATYSADGTVGFKLTITTSNYIELSFGSWNMPPSSSLPVPLNQWQLIGWTAYSVTNMLFSEGTVFVGTSSQQFSAENILMDISAASVIRIGDAIDGFSGDVSIIRIMTPGGGIVRTTDLCSSDNSIELGIGSFALACSGTNSLNVADNECVAICPSNSYSTSEAAVPSCVPCPSHCATCNDIQCLTCDLSFLLYQGDCVDSCPAKTYSTGSACESCSANCAECDNQKCLVCNANHFLYKGGCLGSCPAKTYSTSTACHDCSANCAECDTNGCKACDQDYFLYEGDCIESCPDKTYSDSIACHDCSSNCAECDDQICLVCDANHFLYEGGCLGSCPAKTYSTSTACHDCLDNCAQCDAGGCKACDQDYFLYERGCFESCPDRTYSTSTTCSDCLDNCAECDAGGCKACDQDYFLYKGDCIESCPDKTYSDSIACHDCSANCAECDNQACLVCDTNHFLYEGGCLGSCPAKTYSTSTACHDCLDNCAECDASGCKACDQDDFLYEGGCFESCPDKTYSDSIACHDCSANCAECNDQNCLVCDANHFLYKGGCLGSCPAKTEATTTACYDCSINCAECKNSKCLICDPNYFLYQGDCVSSCPAQTYSTSKACNDCSAHCLECDSQTCLACNANYLLYGGSCLSSCPAKTYSTSTACIDCSTNCELCNNSGCLTCEANFLLSKGDCVDSCPAKSYSDLTFCITCSDYCDECDADGCKACDQNYELNTEKECTLTPPPTKSGLSTGALSGIVCGSIILVLLALLGKIYFNDKKALKRASKLKYAESQSSSSLKAINPVSPISSEANLLVT